MKMGAACGDVRIKLLEAIARSNCSHAPRAIIIHAKGQVHRERVCTTAAERTHTMPVQRVCLARSRYDKDAMFPNLAAYIRHPLHLGHKLELLSANL